MAKEGHFIKIINPKETRKLILEDTRDILRVLQGYEDYKRLREKRSSLINTFKNEINDIRSLVKGLKKILPKVKVKGIKKTVVKILPGSTAHKPAREVKQLEEELADIEEKLSNL